MIKAIFYSVILCLASQVAFAQQVNTEKLDSFFLALEKNNKWMGTVALSKNGTVVYNKSLGYADLAEKQLLNETTKFRIGSISKTFTSVLIYKAIEDKKLTLSTTLDKYYPQIKNANKITIEQMLKHSSGIFSVTDDKTYLLWNTKPATERELVGRMENAPSNFEPGTQAAYSNSNYILLSFILEKIYKKTYAQLIEEKITKPVGLKNTLVGSQINVQKNEANSYSFLNGWNKEAETDMSVPMGAGAIVSTPTDLIKFAEALFSGKLISKESLNSMTTIINGYGSGLFEIPFYEKSGLGHTGGIDGFSSFFGYFNDDKVGFAITSNGNNFSNNDIAIVLLKAIYNKDFEVPDFNNLDLSAKDLEAYAGFYSSDDIPLQITITSTNKTLSAQATGQAAFPLEITAKNKFKFDPAGIVIEFNPALKQMLLIQGGKKYLFVKE